MHIPTWCALLTCHESLEKPFSSRSFHRTNRKNGWRAYDWVFSRVYSCVYRQIANAIFDQALSLTLFAINDHYSRFTSSTLLRHVHTLFLSNLKSMTIIDRCSRFYLRLPSSSSSLGSVRRDKQRCLFTPLIHRKYIPTPPLRPRLSPCNDGLCSPCCYCQRWWWWYFHWCARVPVYGNDRRLPVSVWTHVRHTWVTFMKTALSSVRTTPSHFHHVCANKRTRERRIVTFTSFKWLG